MASCHNDRLHSNQHQGYDVLKPDTSIGWINDRIMEWMANQPEPASGDQPQGDNMNINTEADKKHHGGS